MKIEGKRFGEERALFALEGAEIKNCRIEGEEDGESFLKEADCVSVDGCYFDLRYPMWHGRSLILSNSEMTKKCRAALWYNEDLIVDNTVMNGIKALRECDGVVLTRVKARSPEFGWRCRDIKVYDCKVNAEYAFFECSNIRFEESELRGKYSFQYCEDLHVEGCRLKTKDAFWHAKNVTVKDSILDGEYLGWYSEGLTLMNCLIIGTQPLCYCKNLRLYGCTMRDCDLSFENSEVEAEINGTVLSVKNPRSGKIVADGYGEIIREGGKYPAAAEILVREQEAPEAKPNKTKKEE